MKFLNINPELKTSLYVQLYEQIKENIEKGFLLAGEKLPSKKELIENYKLSQSTVQNGLYLLLEEGYIFSIERKGYYVSNIENLILNNKSKEIKKITRPDRTILDFNFSYSGVDKKSLPRTIFKKITKNIYNKEDLELLFQGDIQGYYPLRKTITSYLLKARGVDTRAENIIISSGTEYLFYIIFNLFKGKTYGLENPGYKMLLKLFKTNRIKFKAIELDQNGVLVDELRKKSVTVSCVTPSHQFPTGVIMNINRRYELLNWANEASENYIVEDDYDSEFKYNGKPIQALKALDKNDKVIYIGSFSKCISPAIRVSYMVLPSKLLEVYKKNLPYFICPVSTLTQKILYEFISQGYFSKHINKMRTIYKKKRELLVNSIKKNNKKFFKEEIEIQGADAGLHLVLKLPNRINIYKVLNDCKKNSIKIYPLQKYRLEGNFKEPLLLLGYANLNNQSIVDGINLLFEVLSKYN